MYIQSPPSNWNSVWFSLKENENPARVRVDKETNQREPEARNSPRDISTDNQWSKLNTPTAARNYLHYEVFKSIITHNYSNSTGRVTWYWPNKIFPSSLSSHQTLFFDFCSRSNRVWCVFISNYDMIYHNNIIIR